MTLGFPVHASAGWRLLPLLLCACAPQPQTIELTSLATGEWIMVDADGAGAVMAQVASARVREGRPDTAVGRPFIPDRRGPPASGPQLARLRDTLEVAAPDTVRLTLERSAIELLRVGDVFFSPSSSLRLIRSPVDAHRYVFERDDAIWLFAAPDTITKLTRDDDVATLRGRQREGVVILYWSTEPVWSADGRHVAFITNRESVRGGSERQSIWIIDVADRSARPLVSQPHTSAYTQGVLGDSFLFSSNRTPGVLSVHPVTGVIRVVSDGFLLGGHPAGAAALIATGDAERRTAWVHRPDTAYALPPPAAGFVWSTQARISPAGDRVALLATDLAGAYRLYVFSDDRSEPLWVDLHGGPTLGPAWVDESALVFASSAGAEPVRTWIARLR